MDASEDRLLPSDTAYRRQPHIYPDNNSIPLTTTTKQAPPNSQTYEVLPSDSWQGSHPRTRRYEPGVLRQWRNELISCVLMIGMLGAILGVLFPYDNQPLPQWPYHISINTVIAVLTTVLKACAVLILAEGISQLKWQWFITDRPLHDLVVFDAASRGPWGCAQLIFSGRGGHLLASLGAALVILTLAVDPFTQQVVRYWDCPRILTHSTASLPRSTYYDEAAAHTYAGIWPIATVNLGFIDQGLYNPGTLTAPFVCPSGNCTFAEPFSTIGYCATCEDISDQLIYENITIYVQELNATTNETYNAPFIWFNTTTSDHTYAATGSTSATETWFTANYTTEGIDLVQAWHYPNGDQPFYPSVLGGNCSTSDGKATWACSGRGGSGGARCNFNPCVRTYSSRIEESKLKEELVASYDMFVTGGSTLPTWVAADVKCAGYDVMTRLAKAGFKVDNDTTIIPWNVMVADNGTASIWISEHEPYFSNVTVPGPSLNTTDLPIDIIPAKCIYSLTYKSEESIITYLRTYFTGFISPGANGASADGPGQIRALFNDSNANFDSINTTFHSIAEALTLRMRQYQSPTYIPVAQAAQGTVIDYETCVRIRWGYLAFPAAIVTLTVLFLVTMIAITSHGAVSVATANWKSSPLPGIFQRLTFSASPNVGAGQNGDVDEIKNAAGGLGSGGGLKAMEKFSKMATARVNVEGKEIR